MIVHNFALFARFQNITEEISKENFTDKAFFLLFEKN